MKKRYKAGIVFGVVLLCVYVFNASWLAGIPDGEMGLYAHRGVHQTYHRDGLTNTTCTAERIDPPSHSYLENTLPSMQAAIDAGGDIVELDIHLTRDGELAVFHDWTVDCRTDGKGETRDQSLSELKALDLGFGYTADNGQTFPFRGYTDAVVPSLSEVLEHFPETQFDINIKSGSVKVAQLLLDYVPADDWSRLSITARETLGVHLQTEYRDLKAVSRRSARTCVKNYVLMGWFGHIPEACHDSHVPVPANYRKYIWGWPHRFEKRLQSVGSRSLLMGPYAGHGMVGLDSAEQLSVVPADYKGLVYTNKIEVIGPLLNGAETD